MGVYHITTRGILVYAPQIKKKKIDALRLIPRHSGVTSSRF